MVVERKLAANTERRSRQGGENQVSKTLLRHVVWPPRDNRQTGFTSPQYYLFCKHNRVTFLVVARMTLLSLPLELLQNIASLLEIHRPSLQAFSLTNTACHAASLPAIFQRICITVRDREGLRRHVDALSDDLLRTESFSCIRQITVRGALRLKDKKIEGYPTHTPLLYPYYSKNVLDEDPVNYEGMYAVYDESVIKRSSEEDMAWAPLVNLLAAEIPLEDLVYNCQSQIPPSLLRIIHEQNPQCRLHHLTFKFRTLLWGVPKSYELELATSPSLHKVKVTCAQRDSDGDDDFNLEAVMELATRLALNLSKVTVLSLFPGGSLRSTLPRGSWQSLPGFRAGRRRSLESLSVRGQTRLTTPKMLQDWARHIDFTCLQQLTLCGCLDILPSGLSGETMEWITQTQSFPRVRLLSVQITRDDLFVEKPHYREQAISFFHTFNSLEQLSIEGPIDYQIMDSTLAYHGQTLRKLSLHPFEETPLGVNVRNLRDIPFRFTKDCVLQLGAQCPLLEELTILVKRDKSSTSEAEIYRCFGKMINLRSLTLLLECSNWRVTRDPTYAPDFNEGDQEPVETGRYPWLKRGEAKKAFINCAVDEALACFIWKAISHNKTGRRLERLKLCPTGAGEYGTAARLPPTFAVIVQNLARCWLCERVAGRYRRIHGHRIATGKETGSR
jgi:hypothetical protein